MLYLALRAAPGRLFKARLKKTVEQQQTGELNRLDGRERTRDQSAEVCLLLWEERAPHCVPNDRCAACTCASLPRSRSRVGMGLAL